MDDLYFDPEIEDYSFTFSDLCKFKFIKNKAHIIQYTQNITFQEAVKKFLCTFYQKNYVNTFYYEFINYEKKSMFENLIEFYKNNNEYNDNDCYTYNNSIKEYNNINCNINTIKVPKKNIVNKKVSFNLELNKIKIYNV